jgi:Excalibur calcium-binding domain
MAMHIPFLGVIVSAAALVVLFGEGAHAQATADVKNCADFRTQQDAQNFLDTQDPDNINGLDGNDRDGIACEELGSGSRSSAPTGFSPTAFIERDRQRAMKCPILCLEPHPEASR